MTTFAGKGVVAALKTTPETVLDDIDRLSRLAGVEVRPSQGRHDGSQDQHLVANVVPGVLDDAVAARGRHPVPALRRLCRPRRHSQRHGRRQHLRWRGQQQTPLRHRRLPRPVHLSLRAGLRVVRVSAEAPLPGAGSRLPGRGVHSQGPRRPQHRPPADGQDPRLHDHHRGDEERLRRAAPPEPSLDPRRHPRHTRRSARSSSRIFIRGSSP